MGHRQFTLGLIALAMTIQPGSAQTTLRNPTSGTDDYFGYSAAAVGTDRVLIGAPLDDMGATEAGVAYLFSSTGTLLTTFTNPTPAPNDYFGWSVAALGSDRVLIGAPNEYLHATNTGAVYLFNTNGTLLATIRKPLGAIGECVAAMGNDRFLSGRSAATFLFSTNGALLATFTNPTSVQSDGFGNSMAAVGTDWVVIGAYLSSRGAYQAGAAYLFNTNGALITTFTNPTPASNDIFGWSVAGVGNDRVLIGEYGDDTAGRDSGRAYLFHTHGALITTFTNPTPAVADGFGNAVAAVGSDRVLIAARGDSTGNYQAGAAYLFRTNGALLATFTNPRPAVSASMGWSVAVLGTNQVLLGAYRDDLPVRGSGAAYLFSLNRPDLHVVRTNGVVTVFWELPGTDSRLEERSVLTGAAVPWMPVSFPYQTNSTHIFITVPMPTGNKFYRLR